MAALWARERRYERHAVGAVAPNESRLSCGATLECSQTEFYNTDRKPVTASLGEGRRQLQARVRQRDEVGATPQQLADHL